MENAADSLMAIFGLYRYEDNPNELTTDGQQTQTRPPQGKSQLARKSKKNRKGNIKGKSGK